MRDLSVPSAKWVLLFGSILLVTQLARADVIDGEELVDPTRPLFASTENNEEIDLTEIYRNVVPASFEINFIRASSENPIAVINGVQVTLGDIIGGATVAGIGRDTVTLLINGQENEISLYKTSVKSAVIER